MEFFKADRVYNFLEHGKIFFGISMLFLVISFSLLFVKGLPYGIDFAGGTVVQVKYEGDAPIQKIREALLASEEFSKASVTEFGSKEEVLIRAPFSMESVDRDVGDMAAELLRDTGSHEIRRVDMVGPKVGDKLKQQGALALFLASFAIMIYVSIRYEWRFAVAAVIALLHDVIITVGAIIIFKIDVNLEVVAALLTILGYSINDTIVVFDRIRESIRTSNAHEFKKIINEAVSKTLSRTTLTSLTVFFVVLTLYLFGGEIIVGFSLPLLVGVIVGTYSSIFIAAQCVIFLNFSVENYRKKEAEALKRKIEKEKIRAMYEKGVI